MSAITPDTIANTINNSISNSIIDIIQGTQDTSTQLQNLSIICDDLAVKYVFDDTQTCMEELLKKYDKETVKKLCQIPLICNANNITMNSSLNISNLINQNAIVQSDISNKISNDLTQNLQTSMPTFQINKVKQKIDNISTIVSTNSATIIQSVINSILQEQNINLVNYSGYNISVSSAQDIVNKNIQSLDSYQSIVSDISNTISQTINSGKTIQDIIITYLYIFAGVIFMIFFIIFILKRKDTRDFVNLIFPYLIFFIAVFLIIYIHLLIKPSYILKDTHTKEKIVDNVKLFFWCFSYIIVFGFCEIIVYKVFRKKIPIKN